MAARRISASRSGESGTARRLMFVDWPLEDRAPTDARVPAAAGTSTSGTRNSRDRSPATRCGDRSRRSSAGRSARGRRSSRSRGAVAGRATCSARANRSPTPVSATSSSRRRAACCSASATTSRSASTCSWRSTPTICSAPRSRGGSTSAFPIRFDYLDTAGGGDLSVHCHPRDAYMREVFGLPYAQDESYYVMVTQTGRAHPPWSSRRRRPRRVPRGRGALAGRRRSVRHRAIRELPPGGAAPALPHSRRHAARQRRGNVVLEISATPYVYSLRLYDWMRAGLDGTPRPVQLDHAFANLDTRRRSDERDERAGAASRRRSAAERDSRNTRSVAIRSSSSRCNRLEIDDVADDDTRGRFHVLNLVEGEEILLRTASGREHRLSYAETIVVPANVGAYSLVRTGALAREGREGFRRVTSLRLVGALEIGGTHVTAAVLVVGQRDDPAGKPAARRATAPSGTRDELVRSIVAAAHGSQCRPRPAGASRRPAHSTTRAASRGSAASRSSTRCTASTCEPSSAARSALRAAGRGVPQRRGCVPHRRVVGGRGAGSRARDGRDARHRPRFGVPRARADRRNGPARAAGGPARPRAVPRRSGRGDAVAPRSARGVRRRRIRTSSRSRSRARDGDRRSGRGASRASAARSASSSRRGSSASTQRAWCSVARSRARGTCGRTISARRARLPRACTRATWQRTWTKRRSSAPRYHASRAD